MRQPRHMAVWTGPSCVQHFEHGLHAASLTQIREMKQCDGGAANEDDSTAFISWPGGGCAARHSLRFRIGPAGLVVDQLHRLSDPGGQRIGEPAYRVAALFQCN